MRAVPPCHLVTPDGIAQAVAADRGVCLTPACEALEIIKSEPGTLVWKQPCTEPDCNGVFKLYRHINIIKL